MAKWCPSRKRQMDPSRWHSHFWRFQKWYVYWIMFSARKGVRRNSISDLQRQHEGASRWQRPRLLQLDITNDPNWLHDLYYSCTYLLFDHKEWLISFSRRRLWSLLNSFLVYCSMSLFMQCSDCPLGYGEYWSC